MEELVASARVVCRSRPRMAANPQACELVAAFLAPPDSWTIERAIRSGCRYLALYLVEKLDEDAERVEFDKGAYIAARVMQEAAAVGDVALMKRLVDWFECSIYASTVLQAVTCGRLEALQWLVGRVLASLPASENAQAFATRVLPDYLMTAAARRGDLEMLQWMSERVGVIGGRSAEEALVLAAESGHLHVVEWTRSMLTSRLSQRSVLRIVRSGHADVCKFLYATSMLPLTYPVMDAIAGCGDLELLQWMYESGGDECTFLAMDSKELANGATWLHFNGFGCSTNALDTAIANGHLQVLKYLLENRFSDTVRYNGLARKHELVDCQPGACFSVRIDDAAAGGHLETIKWLHASRLDVFCTYRAIDRAAENGHLEVVKFLHETRREGCTVSAMNRAAMNGHLAVVEWLHVHGVRGCTTHAMNKAAAKGHLDIVKFLHAHRTEGCTTDAMDRAASLEILQWLSENRREGFTHLAITNAVSKGDMDMLAWLRERTTADMWTASLARSAALRGQMEVLQWLHEHFPACVDAQELADSVKNDNWRVWKWLSSHREVRETA